MKKSIVILLLLSILLSSFGALSAAAPSRGEASAAPRVLSPVPSDRVFRKCAPAMTSGAEDINEYILSVAGACAEEFRLAVGAVDPGTDEDGALLRQILDYYADQSLAFTSAAIFTGGPEYRPDPILSFAGYSIYGPSYLNCSEALLSMLLPNLSGSRSFPCPTGWTEDVCVLLGRPESKVYLWIMLTKENGSLSASYAALEMLDTEDFSRYWDFIEVYNSVCFFPPITYCSPYGPWDQLGSYTNIPGPDELAIRQGGDAAPGVTEYADAFSAYLALLEQERGGIDGYTWQMGYYGYGARTPEQVPHPVVIRDVWGDDTPELIYARKEQEYAALLRILTWEDGQLRELYSAQTDIQAGGGERYFLCQLSGAKDLYLYISTGDEWWSNTYYALKETAQGALERVEHLRRLSRPGEVVGNTMTFLTDYTLDGRAVTEAEFNLAEADLRSRISGILMYNANSGEFTDSYVAEHGCPAMTSDEAISWLREQLGGDDAEPEWSAVYRDFVLNRTFLIAGDPYRGYGDLETGAAVVTFALYDIDADGTPELLIFNGFNGRDLQATYVFTCTGSGVAYCGSLPASVYGVDSCPGVFTSLTTSGWYLDDQYAGKYSEVTALTCYTLQGTEIRSTSVSVTGVPLSPAYSTVISRTPNAALYAASQQPPLYLEPLTWQELNVLGWRAFAASYRDAAPTAAPTAVPGLGPSAADMAGCDSRVVVPNDDSWLPAYEKKIVNASLGVCIILRWAPVDEYVMEGYNYLNRVWQGETVTVLARQGAYSLIRTAAGEVGWATTQFLDPAW